MQSKTGVFLLLTFLFSFTKISSQENLFQFNLTEPNKPWTDLGFENNPENFQFAIVTDRTGGHRKGVFGKAVEKLNLLRPEFVMSVGDLIEGYTKDTALIDRQWAEFDSLLNPLDMRFFYLPGNHDISNEVMREEWKARYGRSYYHFIYKNVLFLAFDTNDGDDDATFSREQIEYFKKAIQDHPEVRWTLLFMHHPIWLYKEFNGFEEVEEVLKDRPYTVFAGHVHRYMQAVRKDRNYYVLATTGGGSSLRGPKFGQFDHLTWVTMTDNGPSMVNLKLDGLLNHDVSTATSLEQARALVKAADFNSLVTLNTDQTAGQAFLNIANEGTDTIHLKGRVYHNHHLTLDNSQWQLKIAPNSMEQIKIKWALTGDLPWERVDPITVDFTIGYPTEPLEPPFQLEGTYTLPKVIKEDQITFSEPDIFTENHQVVLEHRLQGMELHYTTDGSTPNAQSPVYDAPISLEETTTIKVALVDPEKKEVSGYLEETYHKVKPAEPAKVRRDKPGLKYEYFQGEFTTLPDFAALEPVHSGRVHGFDVEKLSGDRIDHYAILYTGYIEVPEDGIYAFYTRSDDGSKVYLHDKLVVDNDGSHSARWRKGYVALKKGKHPIRVEYFEDFLGQELQLYMQKPGEQDREVVPFNILSAGK